MSDYLANLVAKSRSLANVVQPRPASPFEPSTPAGLPIDDRAAADAETGQGVRFPRGTPSDDSFTRTAPIQNSANLLPPPIGVSPQPVLAAGLPSTTPAPGSLTVRQSSVVPPSGTNGATFARSRSGEHPESVFTPDTNQPQSAPVPRERAPSMIGPVLHDRSASTFERDAVPTIKISIGRVDVRAIMTPPAPRPAFPPRGPALSLTDYLKRNDERKR